ncbi:MAG: PTS sugar transporter subunit IIA [Planctomycetota bacterium]|jgi:mannitol/fructose-specific phosphotransferase system IIA component (Ntr-type)
MKLMDFITRKAIVPNLKAKDKRGVVQELVQKLKKAAEGEKINVNEVVKTILEREKLGSTGLGGGVAVPHAKLDTLKNVRGAFGRCPAGVDFNAVDGEPVTLVFLILSPSSKRDAYLQALQKTMQAIRKPNFCKFLRAAKNVKDMEDIFKEVEEVAKV